MSKNYFFLHAKTLTIALLAIGVFLPAPTEARFDKDLKLGDVGEDVRELQEVLNIDSKTRLASSGPGSPGQETPYFGHITRNAVIRFQELYGGEILFPLGLSSGTGYVGALTRKKLSTFGRDLSNTGVSETRAFSSPLSPKIFSVSPISGSDGTSVTLIGEGFLSTGNKVYASFAELEGVSSPDGKTISFVVRDPFPDEMKFPPQWIGKIPNFEYGFVVENENGRSEVIKFTLINSKVNGTN